MAVYIDNMNAPYRNMKMCHMIADTRKELDAMADRIGVSRRWIQKPGTSHEHYDICQTKKQLALTWGAKAVTMRELGEIIRRKKQDD